MTKTAELIEKDFYTEGGEPLPDEAAEETLRKAKRKKLFIAFAGGLLLAGAGYQGYEALHSGHVTTDNAYVGADIAQVTPLVAGHVAQVLVSDAQTVTAGQPLVILDQTDARLALAEAEAAYDQARRRVTGYVATDRQLAAQISMRGAEASRAAADVQSAAAGYERARLDYSRRAALAETGAISGEELSTTRAAFEQAQAALSAARAAQAQASSSRTAASGQRDSNQALIAGASVDGNPEVAAARARLDQARVNLERTIIRAPVPGIVSRRQVQVGQRLQPGAILMVVVPV
ncbi:MAG: HlyD family secretion protein, partial [Allosphingosinicella sp.]